MIIIDTDVLQNSSYSVALQIKIMNSTIPLLNAYRVTSLLKIKTQTEVHKNQIYATKHYD